MSERDQPEGPLGPGPHPMAVNHTGPWVQAAAFCDAVIEGKDDTFSLIRIVDRFFASRPAGLDMTIPAEHNDDTHRPEPRPNIRTNLALMFKAGAARGTAEVLIIIESPDGLRNKAGSAGILFEGEDRGAAVMLPLEMAVRVAGLYWFDIFVDDVLMTRVPMRVVWRN